jgi:hypothetical protein
MQTDQISIEKRHAIVSTVALLSLRCVRPRLKEAGLAIGDAELSAVQQVARAAFDKLVDGADRIEEMDFSEDRLFGVWADLMSEIARQLAGNSARVVQDWIGSFHAFLQSADTELATKLLRLRADPVYLAGRLPPVTRQTLAKKTVDALVPVVQRDDVVPTGDNDLGIYSYWDDAGNPVNVLDQFVCSLISRKIVEDVAKEESAEGCEALKRVFPSIAS